MGPLGAVYSEAFLIVNRLQMQAYYSNKATSSEGGRHLRTNLILEMAMRCGLFAGKEHGWDGENWVLQPSWRCSVGAGSLLALPECLPLALGFPCIVWDRCPQRLRPQPVVTAQRD